MHAVRLSSIYANEIRKWKIVAMFQVSRDLLSTFTVGGTVR